MEQKERDYPLEIYLYRVRLSLTQEEMGKLLGLTGNNLGKLERGDYKVSKRVMTKFNMLILQENAEGAREDILRLKAAVEAGETSQEIYKSLDKIYDKLY